MIDLPASAQANLTFYSSLNLRTTQHHFFAKEASDYAGHAKLPNVLGLGNADYFT
ncbi:hypothetical protein ACFFQ5_22245 [Pseudomonas brassicacearum]|jgi:hypothetical protein|uniref:hypothetical protein n=1 Tax=Pseudomonas TaxID=286 RepID=UPI0012DAFCA6|nr:MULTISPECIES: hypothetical protein [Pseudomonas]QIB03779.1 hypothetical protein GZ982_03460 [Pseudomonas fluorescens]URM25764.1 hypothetical protein LLY42_17365 [Pseudomonas frederiksbergensis]NJP59259.1 hypothetical protein [Pseudomonas brassicacearum]WLG70308.1 hypothetical protein PSH71_11025 [Pseudomonas brassicacearum]WLI15182.1 hypothetical protein PSH65_14135 [Pseudomonas sp. FP603]